MRMQEMITEFRNIMPALAESTKELTKLVCMIADTREDLQLCNNPRSKEVLINDIFKTLDAFDTTVFNVIEYSKALQELNEKYQHKVGRRVAKPKNDPRQMELAFGEEPVL
jgi:uncharacterized protein YoxC